MKPNVILFATAGEKLEPGDAVVAVMNKDGGMLVFKIDLDSKLTPKSDE